MAISTPKSPNKRTDVLTGLKAVLKLPDGREIELDVLRSTLGKDIFCDIRNLHAQAGVLVYDPGLSSVASCASAVTYVDGDAGLCLYRGLVMGYMKHPI